MKKIKRQIVEDFLDELASSEPTPGGGAVAALSGALAAGLCQMVARLTKADTKKMLLQLESLQKRLLELADEDCKAFNEVIKAYHTKDNKKVLSALDKATAVPLETAKLVSQVELIARVLGKRGNKNAYSDARSAFYLAKAAKYSALENVKINQKSLIAKKKQN